MARPKDAKVWNEDLVEALRARANQARQQNKSTWQVWQQGAQKVEAVRKDIYTFRNYHETKKIVNFPTGLKPTVDSTCRAIIEGIQPIYPEGYVAPTAIVEGNHMTNFPYLKKIKRRGGAYAILIAFHLSPHKTLQKNQIMQAAQPFCDEMMEANWHQGRAYGAWKSKDTLISNGLITCQKRGVAYNPGAGGFRSAGSDSFTLTRDGELFIEAMLEKWPDIQQEINLTRGNGAPAFATESPIVSIPGSASAFPLSGASFGSPGRAKKAPPAKTDEDEKELQAWLASAHVGEQKRLKVSKARRQALHDICERINTDELARKGQRLHHESDGFGNNRALYVTLLRTNGGTPLNLKPPPPYSTPSNSYGSGSLDKEKGHKLSCGTTSRQLPPAGYAAAQAALYRQAVHESKTASSQVAPNARASTSKDSTSAKRRLTLDACDEIEDRKPAAKEVICLDGTSNFTHAKRPPRPVPQLKDSPVIDLESSDDDIPPPSGLKKSRLLGSVSKVDQTGKQVSKAAVVAIDLTGEEESNVTGIQDTGTCTASRGDLVILIDDTERNRNDTPRLLRTELDRQLTSGPLRSTWPSNGPVVVVEESSLPAGDFAFTCRNHMNKRLPVWVERKRVNDLVQRSSKLDHWFQLHRLRDGLPNDSGFFVFLIEGDFRNAVRTAPYALHSQDIDESPLSHVIDDEAKIVKFMIRAFLLTDRVRFLQTREEQTTLRSIGALSLVSYQHFEVSDTIPKRDGKSSRVKLETRLKNAAVPRLLARRVAEEIGSEENLKLMYSRASDLESREQLLSPVIEDLCQELDESGSAWDWSRAIHAIFNSSVANQSATFQAYQERKEFVENNALLLYHIHTGMDADAAVTAVFDEAPGKARTRKVSVTTPSAATGGFPTDPEWNESSFYFTTVRDSAPLPAISFQTSDGSFKSEKLFVFVVEADILIDEIRSQYGFCRDSYDVARQTANVLLKMFKDSDLSFMPKSDRAIMLLRGLETAVEKAAKTSGYRIEFRPSVGIVLAHLMVDRIATIQAIRKADKDFYLREIALACFHHHYLLHKI